jgi:hypothetical protein
MKRRQWLPWPNRRERWESIAEARDEYTRTVVEGEAVEATVTALRAVREANHFRVRFQAALRG